MKNILFIEAGTTGGGSFESLYQYLKIIDRSQFSPFVICFNETKYNTLWAELNIPVFLLKDNIYTVNNKKKTRYLIRKLHSLVFRNMKIPFYPILRFVHYTTINKIRNFISNNSINIVYLNNQIKRDLVFVIATKNLNVRIISHQRSLRSSGFSKKMALFANKNVDFFIANSKSCYTHWVKLGISPSKMKIIYNFLPDKKYNNNKICKRSSLINIGTLANFTEAKGHDFLIDTFKDLVYDHNDNYRLFLGGYGDGEVLIRKKVLNYKLEQRVFFLGYVNSSIFFSKIDILIVPSKNEAFGRVILEGMQAGIPVIATKVGGIPEIISNRRNGLLVDYGNKEELINAILFLSSNNSFKKKIVIEAKKTISRKFSTKQYLLSLNKIYQIID